MIFMDLLYASLWHLPFVVSEHRRPWPRKNVNMCPLWKKGKPGTVIILIPGGAITPEDPLGMGIDCIFTMCGDTLMNGKEYKKVYCQFDEYYGDKERHYYCAVREEAYQVFIMEEGLLTYMLDSSLTDHYSGKGDTPNSHSFHSHLRSNKDFGLQA